MSAPETNRTGAASAAHVSIPYGRLLKEFMPLVISRKRNVEVGLDADALDGTPLSEFRDTAAVFSRHGISCTLHAPFIDLSPGAQDRAILEATRERLRQFAGVARLFDPLCVVLHTGWDRKHYGYVERDWTGNAAATLGKVTEALAETTRAYITLENVYEKTPKMLLELCRRINHKRLGFCLDTGHVHAFSTTPLDQWLAALGPRIREIHLHDNLGDDDHHLAPGQGSIDFRPLVSFMKGRAKGVVVTLEAHTQEGVLAGLDFIGRNF